MLHVCKILLTFKRPSLDLSQTFLDCLFHFSFFFNFFRTYNLIFSSFQGSGDVTNNVQQDKTSDFAELKAKVIELQKEKVDLQEKISNKVQDKVLGDDILVSCFVSDYITVVPNRTSNGR